MSTKWGHHQKAGHNENNSVYRVYDSNISHYVNCLSTVATHEWNISNGTDAQLGNDHPERAY